MSPQTLERVEQQRAAREARIRELIKSQGLALVPFGRGWRIYGPRIDIVAADLGYLDALDLRPQR